MTLTLLTPGPTGQSYKGTIQRQLDGFYRDANDETFTSGPSFVTKGISMTEGTAENIGSYTSTGVIDPTTWSDGYYTFRTHDTNQSNKTVGASLFNIKGGQEASAGASPDFYYADIQFMNSSVSGTNNYSARWFKNNMPVSTGISGTLIEVTKFVDGTDIVSSSPMAQIGALSAFRYIASGAQLITDGAPVMVTCQAMISGVSGIWSRFVGRDL